MKFASSVDALMPKVWVTPLVHPASILRGNWRVDPAQRRYLKRLVETVKEGREPPRWNLTEPPAPGILLPSLRQFRNWMVEAQRADLVSMDIETAGPELICCGMQPVWTPHDKIHGGPWKLGTILCLRFRRSKGGRYWTSWPDHLEATRLFDQLLRDPKVGKLFHNGVTFDVPMLMDLGFQVEGELWDTMILHHEAYKEMQKGLQFLATLYEWAPVWKSLTDEGDEEDGKS